MYTRYYGFKSRPFDLLPDPRFLYLSKEHELALTHLEYGITDNKGFIVLTGDVGTGKTTLINHLLKKIEPAVNTALIYNTNIDARSFLEMIVRDFGLETGDSRLSTLYNILYQFLLDEYIQGRRSILIIDEAQNMPTETMEEVRMLSNFETEDTFLLQIIMAGQPQLRKRLNDPELAQLSQRISVYYHLPPLERSEIGQYIEYRLKVTGYDSDVPLFTSNAIEIISEYTKGVPRLISSICDTALVYGYADEIKTIDSDIVQRVIKNRESIPATSHGQDQHTDNKSHEQTTESIDQPEGMGGRIHMEVSNLYERLAGIEQRIGQLENIKNDQTVSKLMEWLKEAREERRKIEEKYNALLLRFKVENVKGQKLI
jgi:general secretion pathway protein A